MKCPKCGNPRVKYEVQRKQLSGVHESPKQRIEHVARCSKCGFRYNVETWKEIVDESS